MSVLRLRRRRRLGLALAGLCAATPAHAQESLVDRLSVHASLNAGYGRADERATLGIPTNGTSDYRTFTLQFRAKLTEKDAIVTQLFNRRVGTSPLANAIGDVTMQWAYWQHTEGDLTFKVGRNPFPRGLLNEVRYIGTVLPFFRPPIEATQEAFDALDGAVATWRADLGRGWRFEQHVFAGGSEVRNVVPTGILLSRAENTRGGQSYLYVPIANLKLGAWAARFDLRPAPTTGFTPTAGEANSLIFSAQAEQGPVRVWAERLRTTGGAVNPIDVRTGYAMTQLRVHPRLSFGGQYSWASRVLNAPPQVAGRRVTDTENWGASVIWQASPRSVLKLEQHWRSGYAFDVPINPVATVVPQVTFRDPGFTRYWIASVAYAF